jgi:hypothetical protein
MPDEGPLAHPTLVSLLICDQVIDDKITNKKSAIGLFNTVLVPQLPTTIPQIVVLASLTEIGANTTIELRLVRDADNSVLFHTHGPIEAPNPLATVDLLFAMHGIRLTAPGQYAFEICCADEILGRRRFQVLQRAPRQPPQPPPSAPSEN